MKNAMLIVLMMLLTTACGGGGSSGDSGAGAARNNSGNPGSGPRTGSVTVNEPVSNGRTYTTRAASLEIRGTAYTAPDNLNCSTSQPTQLNMMWRNAATGQSGPGSIQTRCQNSFLGFLPATRWGIPYGSIDLAPGMNQITISVSGGGRAGSATISVNRLEDTLAPVIVSRSPAPGVSDFAVNSKLSVTFSEPMLLGSLTPERFRIENPAGARVGGNIGYLVGNEWTFEPASPLAYSTPYTVTIDGDVEDLFGGNTMGADVTWTFTTAANPDVTPPSVTGVSPAPNLSCAGPDTTVTARFSEAVDSATAGLEAFQLATVGGSPVEATISHNGDSAELRPLLPLSPGADYEATLSAGITDLAGNALGAEYSWSFRTAITSGNGGWTATSTLRAPEPRYRHTAVWTGSEVIVWGGELFRGLQLGRTNSGGRYDPVTDRWTPTSTDGAPWKMDHTAIWTGTEMIVWGDLEETGGRYDPVTDTWRQTSPDGAPSARTGNAAVWTGSEMIIWGGMTANGALLGDGARYDPAMDTWTAMSGENSPSPRRGALHVWTGTELIVWGGGDRFARSAFTDGARYNPATDTWTPIAATELRAFAEPVAVWSGTEMIVWDGGTPASVTPGGAQQKEASLQLYDPAFDTWRDSQSPCEPYVGSEIKQAHWAGNRMFVWTNNEHGGYFYDPATDDWEVVTTIGAPKWRRGAASAWADGRFILWGGTTRFDGFQDTGFVFTP